MQKSHRALRFSVSLARRLLDSKPTDLCAKRENSLRAAIGKSEFVPVDTMGTNEQELFIGTIVANDP